MKMIKLRFKMSLLDTIHFLVPTFLVNVFSRQVKGNSTDDEAVEADACDMKEAECDSFDENEQD